MAQSNKRYFNTFFFEDPYIEELDSETTLLYITMILNPHNNLAGCYEITVRKLMNYTKLSEDKVKLGIQKLVEDRKILFSGNWLALKNFIKNNNFNPNMCKSAFDIMKSAPADKVLFILSNHISGQLEPWVIEFIPKVESGINAKIDSQNRSLIKEANKKGLPEPKLKQHQVFTTQSFMSELDQSKNPTVREPFPQGLPQPCAEQEYKPKFKYESKIELETEDEKESSKPNYQIYNPNHENNPTHEQKTLSNRIQESIDLWNTFDNLPKCKYNVTHIGNDGDLITKFDVYRDGEILGAIKNLSELYNKEDPKYVPKVFSNFIKTSLDRWTDDSKPHERLLGNNNKSNYNENKWHQEANFEF